VRVLVGGRADASGPEREQAWGRTRASFAGTLVAMALSVPMATGCGGASARAWTQALAAPPAEGSAARGRAATPESSEGASTAQAPATLAAPRPHIIWDPIPFHSARKAQMVAYARRHYGSFMAPTYRLLHPRVIVIHFTETPSFRSTFNTFAADTPDPELHELPNTCAHFAIDVRGGIHQLVPLGISCRHAVGLNWTAIGIEHVGYSDADVLADSAQMSASLRLVRWLRCRYRIAIRDVIGHNESLSSPYHREDVPALRTQTHADFNQAHMNLYRRRLARAGGCA
jgi:N-acetylmuramoyl-L-alanine amidase